MLASLIMPDLEVDVLGAGVPWDGQCVVPGELTMMVVLQECHEIYAVECWHGHARSGGGCSWCRSAMRSMWWNAGMVMSDLVVDVLGAGVP